MENVAVMTQSPKPEDHLLNPAEVAAMLDVDISWVRNHCKRVEPLLPHIALGSGRYVTRRFRKSDILRFIEDHFVQPRLRRRTA